MELEKIKQFYKLNFWIGILSFIIPILIAYTFSTTDNDYLTKNPVMIVLYYLYYKLSGVDFHGERVSVASAVYFIFYFLFFIFYFLFFINSHIGTKNNYNSISALKKTKWFTYGCYFLFFVFNLFMYKFNWSVYNGQDLNYACYALCFLLYWLVIHYSQRYIVAHFQVYMTFYKILCIIPIGVIIIVKNMTLLNYQIAYYNSEAPHYPSWVFISFVFSPLSYLCMPLFFSFNHYIILKKLILETSKEELPKDFFKFKFSYE